MAEIGKEYAEALFSIAREDGSEKACGDALRLIGKALEAYPDYLLLLSNPGIPANERAALLEQAFAGRVPDYVLSCVSLMSEKGQMGLFSRSADEYEKLYQVFCSVSVARVISAAELTEQQKELLLEKLKKISGHDVTAVYELDKTLLGGVKVMMDGKVIDGTVRHQLQEMKDVIGK